MGHYDDIIDERDQRDLERRAKENKRSVKDQLWYENDYLPSLKFLRKHEEYEKRLAKARRDVALYKGEIK